jgi:hypothetical protein
MKCVLFAEKRKLEKGKLEIPHFDLFGQTNLCDPMEKLSLFIISTVMDYFNQSKKTHCT